MKLRHRRQTDETVVRQPKSTIEDQSYAFRRSRTLTGSASSKVSSVNESGGNTQLKSDRVKGHELRHVRRWLGVGFAVSLLGIGACIWLLDQYVYTINSLSTNQVVSRAVDISRFQKATNDYFANRPFERFRFALNEQQFMAYIKSELPEVSTITLHGDKGLLSTEANVTLRRPVAVWRSDNTRLYVDNDGATFKVNNYAEPSVTIEDQSGLSTSGSTQYVASSRLLTFAGKLVSGIDASGVGTVSKVVIPLGSLRQLDVSLEGKPYRLKTQMDREPGGQVADAVAALNYFSSKNITPEYVDVRVEGRAYYR